MVFWGVTRRWIFSFHALRPDVVLIDVEKTSALLEFAVLSVV